MPTHLVFTQPQSAKVPELDMQVFALPISIQLYRLPVEQPFSGAFEPTAHVTALAFGLVVNRE